MKLKDSVCIKTLWFCKGMPYQRVVATNVHGVIVSKSEDLEGRMQWVVQFERLDRRQYSHFYEDELEAQS